mmetsp:Transcript_63991/g.166375  ORF Transcript_63991/g.166375 Transcript_63991/m.166375 type:complete len:234 (+) Transcript_63991:618-1319(+)
MSLNPSHVDAVNWHSRPTRLNSAPPNAETMTPLATMLTVTRWVAVGTSRPQEKAASEVITTVSGFISWMKITEAWSSATLAQARDTVISRAAGAKPLQYTPQGIAVSTSGMILVRRPFGNQLTAPNTAKQDPMCMAVSVIGNGKPPEVKHHLLSKMNMGLTTIHTSSIAAASKPSRADGRLLSGSSGLASDLATAAGEAGVCRPTGLSVPAARRAAPPELRWRMPLEMTMAAR